jgi:hypothetical protein
MRLRTACLPAAALAIGALAVLLVPAVGWAQSADDPARPQKHFALENPAGLTGADAEATYKRLKRDLVAGYGLSGEPYALHYAEWRRYNTVPYRSSQHGERFVNNYANDAARQYGLFERSGPMPVGAILAKDSFAVTKAGDVFSGPLFVMEKMQPGFNPESADWRYTMIMPDGSLLGTTNGTDSESVYFCVTCHAQTRAENDHMFYVPAPLRVPAAE